MAKHIWYIDETGAMRTLAEQIELEEKTRWAKRLRRLPPDTTKTTFHPWQLAPLTALMRDIIRHKNIH